MRPPSLELRHPEVTRAHLFALARATPGARLGLKIAALLLCLHNSMTLRYEVEFLGALEEIAGGADGGGDAEAALPLCEEDARISLQTGDLTGRLLASGEGEELIAAELRTALAELGKVVGEVYTDEVLDLVFSRFCVGK